MEHKELHGKGHILHVMLFDLLFGKEKSISGGGALKRIIMTWAARLNSDLIKMKLKRKIKDFSELIPEHLRQTVVLPRWVRVNHLNSDTDRVVAHFAKEGWTEMPFNDFMGKLDEIQELQRGGSSSSNGDAKKEVDKKTAKKIQEAKDPKANSRKLGKVFARDRDLPDLLAFPPLTDFHDHAMLLAGHIVLQDKASALSGAALGVPAADESVALDACAAPGQKTSQVAQSMKNKGKLFAFDLDATRLETLKRLCKRNGLRNLTAVNSSFLDIDVMSPPYCEVEYILLDPSCSGSGIINRLDYFLSASVSTEHDDDNKAASSSSKKATEAEQQKERVLKLQEFQLSMIQKAFTFPKLKQLVYSTCSIHDEENEQVVEKALKLSKAFECVRVHPHMPMRGHSSYPHGDLCVRTLPERDHTIGFFVSLFQRKASHPSTFVSPANASSAPSSQTASKKRKHEHSSSAPTDEKKDTTKMEVYEEKPHTATTSEPAKEEIKPRKQAKIAEHTAPSSSADDGKAQQEELSSTKQTPKATSNADGAKKKKNKNKPKPAPSRPLLR